MAEGRLEGGVGCGAGGGGGGLRGWREERRGTSLAGALLFIKGELNRNSTRRPCRLNRI